MSENFASRIAQANLASKNDVAAFIKQTVSERGHDFLLCECILQGMMVINIF